MSVVYAFAASTVPLAAMAGLAYIILGIPHFPGSPRGNHTSNRKGGTAVKFVLGHWKDILLAALALVVFWAFMPAGLTRKGAEAAARAEVAIAEANKRVADAAEKSLASWRRKRTPLEWSANNWRRTKLRSPIRWPVSSRHYLPVPWWGWGMEFLDHLSRG